MRKDKILVVGANGQIGSVLTEALCKRFSPAQVIASDIRPPKSDYFQFEILNILDSIALNKIIEKHEITQIYHLAAILSAKGEQNPKKAWDLNINGLLNVLEAGQKHHLSKIFFPSSISVFGPHTPQDHTNQWAPLAPTTIYGISKEAGENWCHYYFKKYGLDVRSLRFPGIISYQTQAGGGTTDYAVDIFHAAVKAESYSCFLSENTYLPMIYMPDAIQATLQLMSAPKDQIKIRTSYNLSSLSFSPKEIYNAIIQFKPNFQIAYKPDFRQTIADSWPNSIDDSEARKDWGWQPKYDLKEMTTDMLYHLEKKYSKVVK